MNVIIRRDGRRELKGRASCLHVVLTQRSSKGIPNYARWMDLCWRKRREGRPANWQRWNKSRVEIHIVFF